jgi:putative phosphoserine phosphatase / 1-acylglycerol-3-phosphate O-acyltransferase
MSKVAAFFDLDRTVLRGASGPAINEALTEVGLRKKGLPGENLLYRAYDVFGENPLGMGLARLAAFAVKGWPVERMEAAGELAVPKLLKLVGGYLPPLLADHRAKGHLTVLATTTPEVLVRPLARELGFDDVVATRYVSEQGRYVGRIEGGFVWGGGKLRAVGRWAAEHEVDLRESYAYSDSVHDVPLFVSVGHRYAVNPDPSLAALATARRWPILHLDVPPGVPTILGIEPADVVRVLVRKELFPYARFELSGVENIPDEGGFILASNHRSYFDTVAIALVVGAKGRPTRFLAKAELFDAPIVGWVARALGGIRVDRAKTSAASSLVEGERVLQAGEGLVILPQGTIPRGEAFFDPVLRGKTGVARLAAASGAPVIPVGLWGTEDVWPRSSRVPNIANVFSPAKVTIHVGPPVAKLRRGPDDAVADTETIMAAIAALLPERARRSGRPSDEELARTYPAGHQGEERVRGFSPRA